MSSFVKAIAIAPKSSGPDLKKRGLQSDDPSHAEDERRVGRGSAVLYNLHVAGQMKPRCDFPIVV